MSAWSRWHWEFDSNGLKSSMHHYPGAAFRSALLRNWSTILLPLPGMLHGQTEMQIAQPAFSLKNGMHLSKSTYHLFSPLTIVFSGWMASGGQALAHTWQRLQKSSTP